MSTAGGAAALTIDILTNAAGLGTGLAQAEAQVNQTAQNMSKKMDAATGRFGTGIVQGFKTLGSAAVIAETVGSLAERMNKGFNEYLDLDQIFIGTIRDLVNAVPVLGPGTLKVADLMVPYGEEAGIGFIQGLYTVLQDQLFGPGKGPIQFAPRFHAGSGVSIMDSINELIDYIQYGTRFRLPSPGIPIGPNEAYMGGLRTEFGALSAREQIRMMQDQRSQMIASRMQLGYGQVDTAFGAFKFAAGDPAAASREIIKKADEQLWVQKRMADILEVMGQNVSGRN